MSSNSEHTEKVRQQVREGYGKIAKQDCCGPAVSCCGSSPEVSAKLAEHIGYSGEELAALPDGANMGLSCGNPSALASLKPGEIVGLSVQLTGEDWSCKVAARSASI